MTRARSDSAAHAGVDWWTALGFSEPRDADWGKVRAAQIAEIRRFTFVRWAAESLGILLIAVMLYGHAPATQVFGWCGVSLFGSVAMFGWRVRNGRRDLSDASRADVNLETAMAIVSALIWSYPPIFFAGMGGLEQQLALWTVTVAMMVGATMLLAPMLLSVFCSLVISGVACAWMLLTLGFPVLAIASATFTMVLVTFALMHGATFLVNKAAEFALEEKEEVVSLLLGEHDEGQADWLWQIDPAKALIQVSKRLAHAFGVDPPALEGRSFLQLLAGDSWESGAFTAALRTLADKLKNREAFSDLILPVTVNAETRWWELSASPRFDEKGLFLGFRGVGSDVTVERRTADKINRMARFDTLTGLPNRLQITEAVGDALTNAEKWRSRCALMMIDLDRFKAVNDTLGHPVGDVLLGRVSERLQSLMGDKDLCGRLGGDEFAIVMHEGSDGARVEKLARRIIDELSKPYEVDQHTLYVGASIGVAYGPRDGNTIEMLIRSADLALYRSKDAGGGTYHVYEPQLHVVAEERRVLEIALRKALERGELSLNYQPVVSADQAVIESFEALLRWTHPELGVVSPVKFIPIAEEARLIGPIGEWALRTACHEALNWPSNVRIAVNVSAEQLHDPRFAKAVQAALHDSGLPPHRLELEVTESVFMREGTNAVAVLGEVLKLGVRLALDDFGTGYSSLGYLSRTKFSTIKIDRSFVQGAARNAPESLAIIRAVVALAESLGMATTAEGVETEEEYAMIRRLGCRKIQGYLFGRPMPALEARTLFANQTRTFAA